MSLLLQQENTCNYLICMRNIFARKCLLWQRPYTLSNSLYIKNLIVLYLSNQMLYLYQTEQNKYNLKLL